LVDKTNACHRFLPSLTRRDLLKTSACGFGGLALAAMSSEAAASDSKALAEPAIPARAKRVIFLFMWGGPSHVDLFDPKPDLKKHSGKSLAGSSVGLKRKSLGTAMGSPFSFSRHGEGGVWISELFPHLSQHADRLCVIRSLHTEGSAHGEALLRLHTGQANLVRPSVGAWVSYGLGRASEELPAFVTISPPRGHGGVQNYGNAFLPSIHQGLAIGSAEIPIKNAVVANLSNKKTSRDDQREQLEMIQSINRRHLREVSVDADVEGLIANYELAFRLQSTMPQILSIDDESKETLDLYGIGSKTTDNFGRQCLLARKFAESGVRYLQVSTDYTWDTHTQNDSGHVKECAKVDKPIAGLLEDLARRGLLEDTLVVWGAEFGRTPTAENVHGRNHHPQAFTMWLAGGGVRGGLMYGTTDDFGYLPAENPVHMHDLHATILYSLGLDHEKLTYSHAGRDFRLTDVYGKVAKGVFA